MKAKAWPISCVFLDFILAAFQLFFISFRESIFELGRSGHFDEGLSIEGVANALVSDDRLEVSAFWFERKSQDVNPGTKLAMGDHIVRIVHFRFSSAKVPLIFVKNRVGYSIRIQEVGQGLHLDRGHHAAGGILHDVHDQGKVGTNPKINLLMTVHYHVHKYTFQDQQLNDNRDCHQCRKDEVWFQGTPCMVPNVVACNI